MKRIYLWLIPLSLVWPLAQLIIFYLRFQSLPPNGIAEAFVFLPFGLLAAFIFIFAWDKAVTKKQKWLSVLGYLLTSPIALIAAIGGGLLHPYLGPAIYGAVPLIIGTSLGFFIGRLLNRNATD